MWRLGDKWYASVEQIDSKKVSTSSVATETALIICISCSLAKMETNIGVQPSCALYCRTAHWKSLSVRFVRVHCSTFGNPPSGCFTSAILAVRLGSYSTRSTIPAPFSAGSLVKSIMRYIFRAPPPRCQAVTVPELLRPPVFAMPCERGLKGPPRHRFSLVVITRPLKPALAKGWRCVQSWQVDTLLRTLPCDRHNTGIPATLAYSPHSTAKMNRTYIISLQCELPVHSADMINYLPSFHET